MTGQIPRTPIKGNSLLQGISPSSTQKSIITITKSDTIEKLSGTASEVTNTGHHTGSIIINVANVSDKKDKTLAGGVGAHLTGRYGASTSKAMDSASKTQGRPKSTLKG